VLCAHNFLIRFSTCARKARDDMTCRAALNPVTGDKTRNAAELSD
jgi:hypothetical protein